MQQTNCGGLQACCLSPCFAGFLDFDRATRGVLDELTAVLEEVAQQGPYAATPLLLMAVLVEGGLSGTLAALLQVGLTRGQGCIQYRIAAPTCSYKLN